VRTTQSGNAASSASSVRKPNSSCRNVRSGKHGQRPSRIAGGTAELEPANGDVGAPRLHGRELATLERQPYAVGVEAQGQRARVSGARRGRQPALEGGSDGAEERGHVGDARVPRVAVVEVLEARHAVERMLGAEQPEAHRGEPLARRGHRLSRGGQVGPRRAPRLSPGDAGPHLERRHREAAAPELDGVREIAHPLAVALEDVEHPPGRAVRALARELVAPQGGVTRHAHQVARGGGRRHLDEERHVRLVGRPQPPARRRLRPRHQVIRRHARPAAALDGQLVAELPVEPGNAGDRERLVPALGAEAVDHLELGAHETGTAILRRRADQLRLPDPEGDAAIGPRLRQQVQARHDGAGGPVDDHGGVAGAKLGMPATDEIARPGGQGMARLVAVLGAQDVADERGEGLRIVGGRVAQRQAVAEVAEHRVSSPGAGRAGSLLYRISIRRRGR